MIVGLIIKYFEEELKRIGKKLNSEEDDLTKYNVEKRIINYLDETKEIAAISKEFELREQDALFAYNSTKSMLEELEKHMDSNAKQVLKNMEFVDKLREASKPLSNFTGFENITTNLGQVDNSGFEVALNTLNIDKKNFQWSSSFSLSYNKNRIKHLFGDRQDIVDANGTVVGSREADYVAAG